MHRNTTEKKGDFVDALAEYVHSRSLFLGFGSEYGLMGVASLVEQQTTNHRYEFTAGVRELTSFVHTFSSPIPLWRFFFDDDSPHFNTVAYAVSQLGDLRKDLREHSEFPVLSVLRFFKDRPYLSLEPDAVSPQSPHRVSIRRASLWFQQMHVAAEHTED